MEDDENIACLIDLKRWKFKGQYHNQFLATCPQPTTIEAGADPPADERVYSSDGGQTHQSPHHISEQSKDYLNRMD